MRAVQESKTKGSQSPKRQSRAGGLKGEPHAKQPEGGADRGEVKQSRVLQESRVGRGASSFCKNNGKN